MNSHTLDFIRDYFFTLPALAKFALAMVMLVVIPNICHRLHLPAAVGLLLRAILALLLVAAGPRHRRRRPAPGPERARRGRGTDGRPDPAGQS